MINYTILWVFIGCSMETNVGGMDRTARLIIGVLSLLAGGAILLGYLEFGTTAGAVVVLIGFALLISGATRKCPLNGILGINTAK